MTKGTGQPYTGRPLPHPAPESAPRVLVVVGPTASGKTQLGVRLARTLGGEVLSADSQQIYRDLAIGTAKPSAAERRAAAHHLVDIADARETLSAAEWARRADAVICELAARGALPIVVGGTGLWVRALLLGLVETPPSDPALRARLEAEAQAAGPEALHARLAGIDPEVAARIPAANRVRVVRALELHALTGRPPSELWASHRFARLRYRARVLGITPPRAELYRRIDERSRAMFQHGLLDEVRALLARGLRDAPALRALGYPQAVAALESGSSLDAAIADTAQATRRYAKRQLTWFRADPLVEWLTWPVDFEALGAELCAQDFRGRG